jgi:flagellar basal-body rod protein FlgB
VLPLDRTIEGLAATMSLLQRRHEVLVSNLANLETPGYRAREVDFGTALKEAFAGRPAETGPAAPRTEIDAAAPVRADGNTVDLDLQMAKLGQNGGRYVALARLLGTRLALLRLAIGGNP